MRPRGILVVDDMEDARLVVSHMAHAQGLSVFEAANGREALEMISENPLIDTVFVDLFLPDMSGLDLLRALAPLKGKRRLCLCAVTGRREEAARVEAMEAGADLFFSKPLHPQALFAKFAAF